MTVDRERGQHSSISAARLTVVVVGDERWRWIEREMSTQSHSSRFTTRLTMVREREMPTLLQICSEANSDGGDVDDR
ncbi:hypothetical protein A2U01_0028275 [Trifolium medium]|uniref:Uncharacterized protein n=1 Tax=Trifolium medium TaxID=97028 RepID=A0A392P746_9FABA|nr:hypothetical protein [Trifolium medium]